MSKCNKMSPRVICWIYFKVLAPIKVIFFYLEQWLPDLGEADFITATQSGSKRYEQVVRGTNRDHVAQTTTNQKTVSPKEKRRYIKWLQIQYLDYSLYLMA